MSAQLLVKRLSSNAVLPTRCSEFAAGYDLSSAIETTVKAGGKALVPTDLAFVLPAGTYGRIAPRSGLAWKNFIDTGAGVIDPDYRGNISVLLFNHSSNDLNILPGDRIAQLILERYEVAEVIETKELQQSERGDSGFGSTGV